MSDRIDLTQPIDIEIISEQDENQLPGMPELQKIISQQPIPPEKIQELKQQYYPNFSEEQIAQIEHTIAFNFEKFKIHTRWADVENRQPSITDFGSDTSALLEDRLRAIARHRNNTAFATLEEVEAFIKITNEPSLVDRIETASTTEKPFVIADIGCGGQVADLLLLSNKQLEGRNIKIIGTGVFDYGQHLRSGFPELLDKLEFVSDNILASNLSNQADLVFSTRTVPYTGIVDTVRFCDAAANICKDGGTVWVGDIEEWCFDFSGTAYTNLAEYLDSQKSKMPNLIYQNNHGVYSICWQKNEGLPFNGLVAKSIEFKGELPVAIKYGVN